MSFLILQAYLRLVVFDLHLMRGDFDSLYRKVRDCRATKPENHVHALESVCSAVNIACIWYWKEALCLQRSAVTAFLLKQRGVAAQLVIGIQHMPFKAHAWVEVDGSVVNDHAYTPEMYTVLDRC